MSKCSRTAQRTRAEHNSEMMVPTSQAQQAVLTYIPNTRTSVASDLSNPRHHTPGRCRVAGTSHSRGLDSNTIEFHHESHTTVPHAPRTSWGVWCDPSQVTVLTPRKACSTALRAPICEVHVPRPVCGGRRALGVSRVLQNARLQTVLLLQRRRVLHASGQHAQRVA